MKSIVILLPYFGKFRADNSFWVKSAELNTTVDFLIITDQPLNSESPNIHIINMSFHECTELFRKKMSLELKHLYPYKLCDFKPAYGFIFQEYIGAYDFWGHCDNDLILGDIRHFITDDILALHDRILTRGHFTLYRNNDEVNRMFMKVNPSYNIVFNSEKVFHFDEHPGTGGYWLKNKKNKTYDKIIFDDLDWKMYLFSDVHKRETVDKIRRYFIYSFEDGKLFRYFWEKDKIGREEIMYVHFQKRQLNVCTEVANRFIIVPNRILANKETIDFTFLKEIVINKLRYRPWHFVCIKSRSFISRTRRKLAHLITI